MRTTRLRADLPQRQAPGLQPQRQLPLIFLRREYAYADPDDGPVVVTRDQIAEFLRPYREDRDSDDARFSRRVDAAVSALVKPWQILEPDPAVDYLFTVSPVVVPLVGPDEMHRLEAAFRKAADAAGGSETDDAASVSADDADDSRERDLP